MKVLHTSDLHIGRLLYGQSLELDHEVVLEQVLDAVKDHGPDILILAGDIFDRAAPPASAIKQFNGFIRRFRDCTNASLVVIAGNHDSADRIDAMSMLADDRRVLIRGPLLSDETPLVLNDEHGVVAFSALPFGNEYFAREVFGRSDIHTPAEVMAAQVEAARSNVPNGARWVITAHTFVSNATTSESERGLSVGGVETVPSDVFAGADYVALGHLHRPQLAGGDHISYSGSPMAFGFDETGSDKSMSLVSLDASGVASIERIPFRPKRRVKLINGPFEDIISESMKAPSDDFFKLVLTDHGALIDPMARIREFYPNTLLLQYERFLNAADEVTTDGALADFQNPTSVIESFLEDVRGEAPQKEEMEFVAEHLREIEIEGANA